MSPRHHVILPVPARLAGGRQAGTSLVKKNILLCLLSATLLILSFPLTNIEFLAWLGFIPLFFVIDNKTKGKAFLWSYLTGFIFWLGSIYWLVHVTVLGMILLVLYMALYWGLFGLLISSLRLFEDRFFDLILISSIWVVLEYIRSHSFTGFPWALLGYSQYLSLPIIQIADITGVWGISFLVMTVNVFIYQAFRSNRRLSFEFFKRDCWVLFLIISTLVYGCFRLYVSHPACPADRQAAMSPEQINIAVVQANIPQELKWDFRSKDFILNKYLELTKGAAQRRPDLMIWPESALPVILEEEPYYFEMVKDFVAKLKVPLLLGAVTERQDSYFNSAILLSREGKILALYDKLHLVPFGEFIPLRKIVRFLETIVPIGDFTPGSNYTIFKIPESRLKMYGYFSVLICFEDLFPELSREFVKRGADFLVNITNDAWFHDTSSPYQHLQASVFRAVENRVFLIRCANTGISAFIDPQGMIVSSVKDKKKKETFVQGYVAHDIPISRRGVSFYCRYGDLFILLCLLVFLYGIILHFRKR